MYLLSQLWWYLLLAFLVGVLVGYWIWRMCSRPMLESRFERSRSDMASRLSLLEDERASYTGGDTGAGDNSAELSKLRSELAALKQRAAAAVADHQRLTQSLSATHETEIRMAREAVAADATRKHADELKEARERAAAELNAKHLDDLKKARDQVATEWTAKHADDVKRARDDVTASLTAAHAGEVKKLQDTAKTHETRGISLSQSDTSARQELDAAKTRHAEELKNARDQVAAEWTTRHAADVMKARDDATSEAARRHADELKKASDHVVAEWSAKHSADVKKARDDATSEAARRHSDEMTKLKSAQESALARHAEDLAQARASAAVQVSPRAPAAAVAPAAIATTDDLKLIWGVGPEVEKFLNGHAITRFEQIAGWSSKDLDWFEGLMPAFKGRPESEKWVEQCKRLAAGWRPQREIGDKPKDILTAARGGKPDDLKLIWGVGPKLEVMLNKAGFFHFDQIAKWTDREIEWVDTQLGDFAGRAVRDRWVEQCEKLASGWRPSGDVGERPN